MTLPADVYQGRPADNVHEPHLAVYFDTSNVTCDLVESLSISGGRSDKYAQADPATLACTLQWDPADPMPHLGQQVRVVGWRPDQPKDYTHPAPNPGIAMFHGTITDIAVEDTTVSIVAAEITRSLDGVFIGDTPWPQEMVYTRLSTHVWPAIKSAMNNPPWIQNNVQTGSQIGPTRPWTADLAERDVDRRPAKDVLEEYLRIGLGSFYYKYPDLTSDSDERSFHGQIHMVSGVKMTVTSWTSGIRCDYIVGDPPPRYWRNYTGVINAWKVNALQYNAQNKQYDRFDAEAHDTASINANGYRAGSVSTTIVEDADHDPQMVADTLLPVTKDVHWCVDNITVLVLRNNFEHVYSPPAASLLRDPGEHGQNIMLDLERKNPVFGNTGFVACVVESKQIDWRPDGWQITLATSHPAMYDAAFSGTGPDPTRAP